MVEEEEGEMKLLITLLCILSICSCSKAEKYPDPKELKRASGTIQHPTYGEYPEEVAFYQGMTLMPGQSTMVTIEIPIERGEEK